MRLDLFEGAEAEPLVKGASPLVDTKHPEREWFPGSDRVTHQRTDDGRPDSLALPFREDLDRSEDDFLGLVLDDQYPDVLGAGLNDLPVLRLKAILEESRLLCLVPPQTRSTYSRIVASLRRRRNSRSSVCARRKLQEGSSIPRSMPLLGRRRPSASAVIGGAGYPPPDVDDAPRSDRPRTNREPGEVARKIALLDVPRIAPLSDYVRELRASHPDAGIPWFDPTEAGTEARILFLLEAPGPRAIASGFISADNNDGTAENMWRLEREAGIDRRRDKVSWNVIPWYIGSASGIRAARTSDIVEARDALARLISLLPELRVVVLFGKAAAEAWDALCLNLPTVRAPHPSATNLNTRPEYRQAVLRALRDARRIAALAY
jgi:uracil-DNA glycosylase